MKISSNLKLSVQLVKNASEPILYNSPTENHNLIVAEENIYNNTTGASMIEEILKTTTALQSMTETTSSYQARLTNSTSFSNATNGTMNTEPSVANNDEHSPGTIVIIVGTLVFIVLVALAAATYHSQYYKKNNDHVKSNREPSTVIEIKEYIYSPVNKSENTASPIVFP